MWNLIVNYYKLLTTRVFLQHNPKISIAEIAYALGFANQSHFIAQFRKAIGTTPKIYRDSL